MAAVTPEPGSFTTGGAVGGGDVGGGVEVPPDPTTTVAVPVTPPTVALMTAVPSATPLTWPSEFT